MERSQIIVKCALKNTFFATCQRPLNQQNGGFLVIGACSHHLIHLNTFHLASVPGSLTPMQRLARLLVSYRKEIRFIVLYSIVAGLINLSLPLGIQAIIGLIAGGAISASWVVLVLFVMAGALLAGILRLMQLSLMEYMQRRLFADSSTEFSLRFPRLNLEQLRHEYMPELANRFFDTLTLQKGLPKLLIDGSAAILQILFSLLLLSFYHPIFVVFSSILFLVLFFLFRITAPRGVETSLMESKYKYKLAYWLEELGRVSVTFKLAGENNFPLERADYLTNDYLNARARHWRILLIQFISSIVFKVLCLGGFLVLGSFLVMENQLNVGQFVASEILILFVVESVEKLILLHETGYDVLTATEKIGQVMDMPIEREDGIQVNEFCGPSEALSVEMRNLTYTYREGGPKVLDNLNLKIEAGERVVVTGYNGSGKSTLLQILSVIKRDFTGILMFNGLPKQNLHLRSLREHIGDVSSQEDLFKGTILENITVGNSAISLQRVLEVAEAVGLGDFIREQPRGLDTEILPGGKNIPGATVSKMLLARALAPMPKMLVLEEAISRISFQDRQRIARYITDKRYNWTLVCVTSDPMLAALCDRIIVLDGGKIVFSGNFDAIQKTEHYRQLFRQNEK